MNVSILHFYTFSLLHLEFQQIETVVLKINDFLLYIKIETVALFYMSSLLYKQIESVAFCIMKITKSIKK